MFDKLRSYLPQRFHAKGPVIPVVRLSGVIGSGGMGRSGLSLGTVAPALERAFDDKKAPAVALLINSPGGSPVQSHLIFQRIRQLASEKGKQVFAYTEDVAASGGYMIACAADEIIADPSSVVGSIGVVSGGFGFDKLIERWDIDRRVYTSGTRKVTLDAFQKENPEDVEHLKSLLSDIHRHFIDLVKSRRGDTLSTSEDLFNGLFWVGDTARSLGLVDKIGDMRSDLIQRYGPDVRPDLISVERGLFRRRRPGISLDTLPPLISANDIAAALEERALWARYGL